MDFKDELKRLSERSQTLKDTLTTEEATKTALVLPFIQALGYDVFNPLEVLPEYTCDIGMKKGERVDYAILQNGEPVILIECKACQVPLNVTHEGQLLRYFQTSKARFGILTNGIAYQFFTDLDEPNKMDKRPFLEVDLLDLRNIPDELKRFHRSYFDVPSILSSASELKYKSELRTGIQAEVAIPSPELTKLIAKRIYGGVVTAKVLEQFTDLLKATITSVINDIINDRLQSAMEGTAAAPEAAASMPATDAPIETEAPADKESRIVTTQEELEGYYIVKSILRQTIAGERITYKDTINYFGINIDDNGAKLLCRLYFNNLNNLRIAFPGEDKKEERHKITCLDDIYLFSNDLLERAKKFI
jgi:hypothetical protein